ncbi:M20/M25/M40 family metallo-hydrolase [Halomicroarcula sp. F13]|uniref:M20/M25/M40 family metallo-hydrolase n=1 Tax=Haloarcula rubra TaxID=2487747 RepID=A0AAW4PY28_9EURY|nr:M20/M25/M40 family metallo-hydrolase [Halomicroarcula rubra]MBX0325516.1 M20/M25/M40 family metallo-hydrolase [Halomicroarcula rubra]
MEDSETAAGTDDNRDRLVTTALDLLSIDTQNPPGETAAAVSYVEQKLESAGLVTRRLADDESEGIVAWIEGHPKPELVFSGHLDTVPYTESEWSVDPLGERDGDIVYGRGASDMKGAVAGMLTAARSLATVDKNGSIPVGFAFVTDEETGGGDAVLHGLDAFESPPSACVIGELSGTPDRPAVAVADKGSIWLTLSSTGEGAHGSRPMLGENVVDRLYATVDAFREELHAVRFDLHPDVQRILTQSVAYYSPLMGEDTAWDLFERPTVSLGTFEGGDNINSVPVTARATIDVRLTASVATKPILDRIRTFVEKQTGVTLSSVKWRDGTYESPDAPLVEAVQRAGRTVTGRKLLARSATGGGDAKTLRDRGISTVEFALGTETAHAVDERTTVDALAHTAEIYAALPAALEAVDGE